MLKSPSCPSCKSSVIWRSVLPSKKNYCCQKCGHSWQPITQEFTGIAGKYIGSWMQDEMGRIESIFKNLLLKNLLRQRQWQFYKGRACWTAWRESDPDKFIKSKTLNELVFWIIAALDDRTCLKWYENYLINLSENKPLTVLAAAHMG
jgi:hypothetical protein